MNDELIKRAADIIANSKKLLVFTGAGISAESGIPTFRGQDGLWENYRVEDVATPEAFSRNPRLVWKFYSERRRKALSVKPNAAHYAVARLEKLFDDFLVVTQNVDDLHRKAGNKKLIEIHGNLFREKCTACAFIRNSESSYEEPPLCPDCGAMLRPDVVWFGEPLPEKEISEAFDFAEEADTVIVIGTSAIVFPAAQIPFVVYNHGGKIIEVNLEPTPVTDIANVSIFEKCGIVLPKILDEIEAIL